MRKTYRQGRFSGYENDITGHAYDKLAFFKIHYTGDRIISELKILLSAKEID